MPRRHLTLVALASLPLLAAGCGSSRAVPVQNRTVGVKLDEYRITPEKMTAPAGELRIIARNRGRLTHNVVVETIVKSPEDQPQILGRVDTLHPGERAETHITLKRGTYRLVCTIGNHDDLGQYGTLVVR
jgi:plastocyanin